jgi:hypothetical protein
VSEDKYKWRADGMYFVRDSCRHCGEYFDQIAVAHASYYCAACMQVLQWEIDARNAPQYWTPTFWPYLEGK